MSSLSDNVIELPKDGFGQHIRCGDALDGYGKTVKVKTLCYEDGEWWFIDDDGNDYHDCHAFTHHVADDECRADETKTIKCWIWTGSRDRQETIHFMECMRCGHTYEHVNGPYEFCPRCGRRIVG